MELTTDQLDSLCRSTKAVVDMLEGPAVCTLEFPMQHNGLGEEVDIKVMGFRCSNPDCDGKVHVQIEIQRGARVYHWAEDRSNEMLFGGETDGPGAT